MRVLTFEATGLHTAPRDIWWWVSQPANEMVSAGDLERTFYRMFGTSTTGSIQHCLFFLFQHQILLFSCIWNSLYCVWVWDFRFQKSTFGRKFVVLHRVFFWDSVAPRLILHRQKVNNAPREVCVCAPPPPKSPYKYARLSCFWFPLAHHHYWLVDISIVTLAVQFSTNLD